MSDVFIILTGSSLNDINSDEKEYIQSNPVIAAGHYLLYWELVGIQPDHFVFPGHAWDSPTNGIVPGGLIYGCVEICDFHKLKTDWYVIPETYEYITSGKIPIDENSGLGKNLYPCKENTDISVVSINAGESISYQGLDIWADSLSDKFWFNSGVGTAINLATVLYPGYNIKLLGNDGGAAGQYFYNQPGVDTSLITCFNKELTNRAKPTSSVLPHYNMSFFNTPYAIRRVSESGGVLYNCNKNSFFTQGSSAVNLVSQFEDKYVQGKKNLFQIPYCSIING